MIHARLARAARPISDFVTEPVPRSTGSPLRGQLVLSGEAELGGQRIGAGEGEGAGTIWDTAARAPGFETARQDFRWLDDLAALGSAPARGLAQRWARDWVARYGRGRGPGWRADIAGARLRRMIDHAPFLLAGMEGAARADFFRALSRQARFLARRWRGAAAGLPRVEALAGLIRAGLALEGHDRFADQGLRALARECGGGIARPVMEARDPGALLDLLVLLTDTVQALEAVGRGAPPAVSAAIEALVPDLRALAHADGGLAQFHGGSRSVSGAFEHVLAASRNRARSAGPVMGFVRLAARRTSVLIDAAPPPIGAGERAMSVLAFEMTVGRRPLIVSGAAPGDGRRRAGASTLELGAGSGRVPRNMPFELDESAEGFGFHGAHDGNLRRLGLTHVRRLDLARDGGRLSGEDMLLALEGRSQRRLRRHLRRGAGRPGFAIRLHLHPDVEVGHEEGALVLRLKNGERWIFSHDGHADLTLDPSRYHDPEQGRSRPGRQIVLRGTVRGPATRLRWELARPMGAPVALRDLPPDDRIAPAMPEPGPALAES
ncbi:heparinase II/III family protein [Pontibaca methylaminivorans]|uniref:Uncharacterized conserved protein, heparinase superfamily n=1 Tax=Pontibaca methylaminivorans TaxID=515897 RepID=A0A1R3WZX9_9RHOB|nr:heparinase II/III family protein [Pontibaca methylaminivorans]SIT83376.1 Uncharacterized conserved protein, heparinase superfamily [Pontibaca methylaminivorans]